MNINFDLFVSELKAMNLLASGDLTRYVLNGVCLDCGPKRDLLVACDGRRLGVLDCGKITGEAIGRFVIPSDFIAALKVDKMITSFAIDTEDQTIKAMHRPFQLMSAKLIEGDKYPNWRSVLPREKVTVLGSVTANSLLLDGFYKVAKAFRLGEGIAIYGHGEGQVSDPSAVMTIRLLSKPQFYGLIMPLRSALENQENPIPKFILEEAA